MSTVRPHSKRDRRRSSRVSISFGGLSEDMIICFFDSYNVLKVWKKFLLCAFLTYDELDIVDEKDIVVPVFFP